MPSVGGAPAGLFWRLGAVGGAGRDQIYVINVHSGF